MPTNKYQFKSGCGMFDRSNNDKTFWKAGIQAKFKQTVKKWEEEFILWLDSVLGKDNQFVLTL